MKKLTALAGVFFVALFGHAMAGGERAEECKEGDALYDPDKLKSAGEFGSGGISQFLRDLPVGFAPSGNQCLGPIPIYKVPLYNEAPTSDTHAMARRLAPELQAFSARTGFEACARMCKTDAGMIVAQTVTIRSHISCVAPPTTCPAGSEQTQETIHSHPPQPVFLANQIDALGWDEPGLVGKYTFTSPYERLSEQDRAQAPVWMVGAEGQLIWLDKPDGKEVQRP